MRNEKRVVYNGHTFVVNNVVPDIGENERKVLIQGIANELAEVFKRGR